MSSIHIRMWSGDEVRLRSDEIVEVYGEAFAPPPNNEDEASVREFAGRFPAHLDRPGFRFVAATDDQDALMGFAYGHTGGPQYWWYQRVTATLPPDVRDRWLGDYFEVLEVAVRPGWQGRGIGAKVFDALLAGLPHRTAALSTLAEPSVARTMYERRGFTPVLSGFSFVPGEPPFTVLARDLPR